MEAYLDEIEKFNPLYALVKFSARSELIIKHILDSLAALALLRGELCRAGANPPRVADAGSGAGLPGIPLAICMPGCQFTLIERMARRAGFLRNVTAALGLRNAEVEEGEIKKARADRFDAVVFRALHPLEPTFTRMLFRLCREGGFLAAWKGRHDKTREEIRGLQSGCDSAPNAAIIPLTVPFLEDPRCLVFLRRPLPKPTP
ncbi:MAG: 16S rRNA (guanine(527)-N(7))-methyltransferase RsmG [Treponema sp.]|nr:16S rRNA (guanine(527)-N(7))-methyltransferase RsmG [Treponema sp.]